MHWVELFAQDLTDSKSWSQDSNLRNLQADYIWLYIDYIAYGES